MLVEGTSEGILALGSFSKFSRLASASFRAAFTAFSASSKSLCMEGTSRIYATVVDVAGTQKVVLSKLMNVSGEGGSQVLVAVNFLHWRHEVSGGGKDPDVVPSKASSASRNRM